MAAQSSPSTLADNEISTPAHVFSFEVEDSAVVLQTCTASPQPFHFTPSSRDASFIAAVWLLPLSTLYFFDSGATLYYASGRRAMPLFSVLV